jgi:Heparinase II/III-like protein
VDKTLDREFSQFLGALRQRALKPYDRICDIPDSERRAAAKSAVETGAYVFRGTEFSVCDTTDWFDPKYSRSELVWLQAWDHLEPVFAALELSSSEELIACIDRTLGSWAESFSVSDVFHPAGESGAASETPAAFASHAYAVSGRLYRLAHYFDLVSRGDRDTGDLKKIWELILLHALHLNEEDNISWQHNHSFMQSVALIAATSRFRTVGIEQRSLKAGMGLEDIYWSARRRLSKICRSHIAPDGVHKEHSTNYQLRISGLLSVLGDELASDPEIRSVLASMREVNGWMIDPNGHAVNFGDSDLEKPVGGLRAVPETGTALFPDGGLCFVRENTALGSTYLAQTCAFHSRFHKQADSGSIVWHDRGSGILIDAGRFGYLGRTETGSALQKDGFWYSDPKRVYCESTRAHNTLEIDGRNHRRYRQAALGGTITSSIARDGVFASRCVIANAGAGQHQRIVAAKPGEWLAVFDTCRFGDGPHDVRQWFHIHPDWTAQTAADRLILRKGDETLSVFAPLASTELSPVSCGETHAPAHDLDPGYLGWWSRNAGVFEPCSAFSVFARGEFVSLATLFVFGDVRENSCRAAHNVTHRAVTLNWSAGNQNHTFKLTSPGPGNSTFDISYAAA